MSVSDWGKPPIKCYECSTNDPDHFCSDPFNKTHPDVRTVICKEYCVKWTRNALSGEALYTFFLSFLSLFLFLSFCNRFKCYKILFVTNRIKWPDFYVMADDDWIQYEPQFFFFFFLNFALSIVGSLCPLDRKEGGTLLLVRILSALAFASA